MEIKHLVFDMGNVLIQYNAQYYVEKYAPSPEDWPLLMREVFQSVEWIMVDHGTLTAEEAAASSCKRLPVHLHKAAVQLYTNWNQDIPLIPGMEELIGRLKQAGYGIYLLSNTGQRYHTFRKNIPALRWFDGEFISADWQLLKPEPAIYRAFCQHFHLVPAQCLFVDDLAQNVYGAQRAGMNGVVFYGDPKDLELRLGWYGVRPDPWEEKEETV